MSRDLPGAARTARPARRTIASGALTAVAAAFACGACSPGPLDVAGLVPGSLASGLVAHWPFDDGAGTTLGDRAGTGHDGAVTGGTWITGRFGGALHFDGSTAITVPSFPQATSSWSLSLWFRPPAGDLGTDYLTLASTEAVFAGGWEMNAQLTPAATLYQFGYWIGPGDSDYVYFNCTCVVAEVWTHLAAVVDEAAHTLSFFAGGKLQGQSAATHPILPGLTTLYFGRWDMPARFLVGDLDDVAIYNRALAPGEVAALAAMPAPNPP